MVTSITMAIVPCIGRFHPFQYQGPQSQSFAMIVVHTRGNFDCATGLRSPSLAGVSEPGYSKAAKAEQLAQLCLYVV